MLRLGEPSAEDYRLPNADRQAAEIKNWVAANGPVSACFVVYQDFFSYQSGIYKHVTGRAGRWPLRQHRWIQ